MMVSSFAPFLRKFVRRSQIQICFLGKNYLSLSERLSVNCQCHSRLQYRCLNSSLFSATKTQFLDSLEDEHERLQRKLYIDEDGLRLSQDDSPPQYNSKRLRRLQLALPKLQSRREKQSDNNELNKILKGMKL